MIPQKVLIIDDEEDLCHLMKSFFVPLGYEVQAAYTLSDGLDLVRSMLPDFIFIDNNLPDGLGWEKVDYIRSVLLFVPDNAYQRLQSRFRSPAEQHSDTGKTDQPLLFSAITFPPDVDEVYTYPISHYL